MPQQQNTIQEEAIRRYDALPDELKQAMSSVASAETIYAIGKKFGLNVEETGNLASLIGYTILGMVPIAKFVDSIKDVTGADNSKVAEIAREVNNKIFLAIREQLKKTHGEKWDERAMTRESGIKNKELGITETPKTAPPTPAEPERAAPKSPWEIKPDGLTQETGNKGHGTWGKSVIPPIPVLSIKEQVLRTETAKAAEAEVKKVVPIPPELPKTREAPQPAPMVRGVEVLKEIKPLQPTTYNLQPTITPTKPETVLPIGLPIMKEAEKLMQTPELPKPEAGIMNKELGMERGIKNNELGITGEMKTVKVPQTPTPKPMTLEQTIPPQTPPAPQTQTSIQQKPAQSSPAQTQKYNADPYREPIE